MKRFHHDGAGAPAAGMIAAPAMRDRRAGHA
jgi:hypothetical protein